MHPASVVHLPAPLALRDLDQQIRQRNVGAVDGDQLAFSVLPRPPALLTPEADRAAGVVAQFD
ncbi:MAG: hypothetical protein WCF66_07975 [Pseudolabrys sp.]